MAEHVPAYDGAAERLAAWRSSRNPAERDRAYAAVLRRQFGPDSVTPPAYRARPVIDVADVGDF